MICGLSLRNGEWNSLRRLSPVTRTPRKGCSGRRITHSAEISSPRFSNIASLLKSCGRALRAGYEHDHGFVLNALGPIRLVAAFRYAQFPNDHLPASFPIWRGGSGALAHFLSGFSWTLDRDCACWFAMRFAHRYPPPLVMKAVVKRELVLAHIESRHEDEIIVVPFPMNPRPDGRVDDWQAAAARRVAGLDRARAERISATAIATELPETG